MKKFGPEAHLGSVVAHWGVYYNAAIQQVLDGKWKNDPVWWGIPQKAVNLEDLNTSVISADAQKQVAAKRSTAAFRVDSRRANSC